MEHDGIKSNVLTTTIESAVNWGRKNSLWPMPFGTACCGIEFMAVLAARTDISRFGAEAIRYSPRQSDLLIVAGRISIKMMPVLIRIYEQMPEPKWVISMGACASTGGVFDTYSVIQGVEQFIPVDVYVPGCPPRPEGVVEGLIKLQGNFLWQTALMQSQGGSDHNHTTSRVIDPVAQQVFPEPALLALDHIGE